MPVRKRFVGVIEAKIGVSVVGTNANACSTVFAQVRYASRTKNVAVLDHTAG